MLSRLEINKLLDMIAREFSIFAIMRTAPELSIRAFSKTELAATFWTNRLDIITTLVFANPKTATLLQPATTPGATRYGMRTKWILATTEKTTMLTVSRYHIAGFAYGTRNINDFFLKALANKFVLIDFIVFLNQFSDKIRGFIAIAN